MSESSSLFLFISLSRLLFLLLHLLLLYCACGTAAEAWLACLQDVLCLYAFSLLLQLLLLIPYLIKARHFGQSPTQVVHKALDLLVHAAPPAIPAVMLLCGFAVTIRLRKQGMNLMFPEVLKVAADMELVCFDKTGTLTGSVVSPKAQIA